MKTQKMHNLVWIAKLQFYNKFLFNRHTKTSPVTVDGKPVEKIGSYVHLRKKIAKLQEMVSYLRMSKDELFLVGQLFGNFYDMIRSPTSTIEAKRMLFNECVLPVMTHERETWVIKITAAETFTAAQRKIDWMMFGITIHDRERATPGFDSGLAWRT